MDFQQVITEYLKWIKDNTVIKTVEEGRLCAISTPFLDRHNDHLEIYLLKNNGKIKLTDDGYTISDLRMSGLEINTVKRESILKTVLNGFGVKMNGNNELYIEATIQNIGQKKHHLLQAILAVNDMFNLAQETVYSLFKEDVEYFFQSNDVFYSKDIKLVGKSGFDHNIDFLIPASKSKSERLIKAVNIPKKDAVLSAIMAFNDIYEMREAKTKNFVMLNDTERNVSAEVVGALNNYNVNYVLWSKREDSLKDFALN